MARQRGAKDVYTGRSGQMAVVAELLSRRCNVAIPEVDVGTDVFAFLDDRDEVARIQVKTAQAERYKKGAGCSAQFLLPMRQLRSPDRPPLYYVLAVRLEEKWADFLILSRSQLKGYWEGKHRFGTDNPQADSLTLTIQFRPATVFCGEVELTNYRNSWDRLPPLSGLRGLAGPEAILGPS
jgi:hypothetical protein